MVLHNDSVNNNHGVYHHGFDTLRLILSIAILFLHFNWKNLPQGYLSADMFFILSGFLISVSASRKTSQPRIIGIFKKLYPQYFISIVIFIIIQYGYAYYPLNDLTYAFAMFQSMGFNKTLLNTPTWFVCVFVWVSTVLCIMKTALNRSQLLFILPVMSFTSYMIIHSNTPSMGLNYSYEMLCFGVPVSVWRGIGGISLGMFVGLCGTVLRDVGKTKATLIEILLAAYMIYILRFSPIGSNYDYIFLAISSAFIFMCYVKAGSLSILLSKFGEKNAWSYNASIGIFLYQMPIITLLRQHMSTDHIFGSQAIPWVIAISLLSCLIYYTVDISLKSISKVMMKESGPQ
ncbi:TPA: acyltransferase family protein [Enterobacter roggenkampii]